jgi:serine/threonine-protein kinase
MISVGQTVGNYKVTAKLGEGGMGVVYLAEHPVIGRKVAIKAIHPELSKNPEVISRFMTEAKSVNQVGNEHIVDISDFGNTEDGEFFFVMEFLQGEALADRLRREHVLAPPRALKIAAQAADALAASHEHGIIHRDMKPENVYLITRGANVDFVKVLDFGLAKLTQGDEKVSHKTRTGSVMGTPYYMSPEQCEGRASVDQRADIYSLGVILFEMVTGKVPFGGEGYGEIIVKHITQAPPSPRAINPLVDDALEKIIFRALAKDRDERFQSMREFRAAILDPQAYAQNAPSISSHGEVAVAAAGADGFSRSELGAQSKPVPTTFRTAGVGELADDLPVQKSRKGLIAGIVGAVAVAAVAAVFAMGGKAPEPTATPAVAGTETPEKPAEPESVTVRFRSEPEGASVVTKLGGEVLGKTPFEHDFTRGTDPLEFVFKREGFADKTLSVVPEMSAQLLATLVAVPVAPPVGETEDAKIKTIRGKKPVKADKPEKTSDKGKKPRKGGALDEDAVLEPSFD